MSKLHSTMTKLHKEGREIIGYFRPYKCSPSDREWVRYINEIKKLDEVGKNYEDIWVGRIVILVLKNEVYANKIDWDKKSNTFSLKLSKFKHLANASEISIRNSKTRVSKKFKYIGIQYTDKTEQHVAYWIYCYLLPKGRIDLKVINDLN